jgi:excisionase family DNA binding protein
MADKTLNSLLSPEEVAEVLAVDTETVRKWLRTGQLSGLKAGRLWRVREEDLQEFLTRHTTYKALQEK